MKPLCALELPLDGRCLVEASAGTGKTYTITTLVLRLLLEKRLELPQILMVTYTRAATGELKARVRARILAMHAALDDPASGADPNLRALVERSRARASVAADRKHLERALYASDEASIFTIHGFCQRLLGDFAFEAHAPLALELSPHSDNLISEIANDYWVRATHDLPADLYRSLRRLGPHTIAQLIARTAHGRAPRVLPAPRRRTRPDLAGWSMARAALAEAWGPGRDSLSDVLIGSKLGFGPTTTPGVLEKLERCLKTQAPPLSEPGYKALCQLSEGLRDKAQAKGKPAPTHPLLDMCEALAQAELAQRTWLNEQTLLCLHDAIAYGRHELARRTREQGTVTFDQLLTRTHEALTGPAEPALTKAIQERFGAALIDEFQDTDPLQYEIFDRALGTLPLLLIGDPKQAIYGFRGADIFAYLTARAAADDAVYTMDTNYRSDSGVLAALNAIYGSSDQPFALSAIRYEPVAPRPGGTGGIEGAAPVELLWTECAAAQKAEQVREIADRVATDIVRTLSGAVCLRPDSDSRARPLSAGDIAVLCRTNRQARYVQQALSERSVPAVLQGDSSVFDTSDAFDLERVLACLAAPNDGAALRSALSGTYLGLSAHEMDALSEDDEGWEFHYSRALTAHQTWLERGFVQAVRGYLRSYSVDARLLARPDGARRWTNLQHLLELCQDASVQSRLGPSSLLRFLHAVRTDLTQRAAWAGDAAQLRLESHADAVTVTTVHRSKGLEYPLVYCPYAWDGTLQSEGEKKFPRFHDPAREHALTLDLGSEAKDAHAARAAEEALSEALRLLYVSLTRAKHGLRIVHGPLRQAEHSALQHLLAPGAGKDAGNLRECLEQLVQQSPEHMQLRALAAADAQSLHAPDRAQDSPKPKARTARRCLEDGPQLTSFSALTQKPSERSHTDSAADHDTIDPEPALRTPPSADAVPLHAFPRGPVAGTFIHELLETVDFTASEAALQESSRQRLLASGLPEDLAESLGIGLHSALHTQLDGAGLSLAGLSPAQRISELEFLFRLDPNSTFDPKQLGRLLKRHAAPQTAPHYAERAGQLSFAALRGYLRGFIDLLFTYRDRYFVLDYKSNDLGSEPQNYAPPKLAQAMSQHHYYLQYLLYTVAVHRYLGRRIVGYEYNRHFGGVYYLFLRGMAPSRGPATGVFYDLPDPALVTELDESLGGAGFSA